MAAQEVIGIDVTREQDFIRAFRWAMWQADQITTSKGFHDSPPTDAECCALVHSEVSEILEYLRNPLDGSYPRPDDKIPEYSGVEAEGADVVIRLLSWYHRRGWNLAEAIAAKMRYNITRTKMHGGKAF